MKKGGVEALKKLRIDFVPFCRKYGIRHLAVFGSMAAGTAAKESDLDLLVDPAPGTSIADLLEMAGEAEEIAGCRVDFVLRSSLARQPNPIKTDRILSGAISLYAA